MFIILSGIPPHVDTHSAFEDTIMSLSLGAQVPSQSILSFKHFKSARAYILQIMQTVLVWGKRFSSCICNNDTKLKGVLLSVLRHLCLKSGSLWFGWEHFVTLHVATSHSSSYVLSWSLAHCGLRLYYSMKVWCIIKSHFLLITWFYWFQSHQ